MTGLNSERAAEIFADALEQPTSDRQGFVRKACATDESLHDEVCTLLGALPAGELVFEASLLQSQIRGAAASVLGSEPIDRSGQTLSHYKLEKLLGRGGMGEVYRAHDFVLGRQVALKLLRQGEDAQLRSRLLREAETNVRLEHPAIAAFYESGSDAGADFFAMEYVAGETLRSRLCKGPLAPDDAFSVGLSLLEALTHAHAHEIVHRDIKPENIMITPTGATKLLDFGVAKKLNHAVECDPLARTEILMTELTGFGHIVGTLGYMSPEQIQAAPISERTDVFSVGAVIYEALTGQKAFPGDTPAQKLAATLARTVPPMHIADVPSEINAILARAMALDPADRYPSAAAFLTDLRLMVTGETLAILPDTMAIIDPVNLASRNEDDWIGIGFGESLGVDLAKVAGLNLVQRNKVLRVRAGLVKRGEDPDPIIIGVSVGCRWVLTGSFQKMGQQLRLTMKLIEVAVGKDLWSEKFDGKLDDLFEMQDRLASLTAESLQLVMPEATASTAPKIEAFEYYARGQRFVENWGQGSLAQARECFEKSIAMDPDHAPALSGLARFHAPGLWTQNTDPAELKTGMALTRQAIAIDPEWGQGHLYLGYSLWRLGHLEEALNSFHAARRLSPGDFYPSYFLSCVFAQMGRFEKGITFAQDAAEIEDRVPYVHHLLGTNYLMLGEFESALWVVKKGMECEKDTDGYGWGGVGTVVAECLRLMGRPDEARSQCLETLNFIQQKDVMTRSLFRSLCLTTLGNAALDQNDTAAATTAFRQSIALVEGQIEGVGRGHSLVQSLAGLARATNDSEPLDRGIRVFEERGPYNFSWAGTAWDSMSLFELACAAKALGRRDEAVVLHARAKKEGCRFELD